MSLRVHVIYDFMHVYYKYLFMLKGRKIRALTAQMADGSTVPVSLIYYPLADIEKSRRTIEARFGGQAEVEMSFCFDSPPTERKALAADGSYKANRVSRLTEEDLHNIAVIKQLLEMAGYSTYQTPGLEADDLVASLNGLMEQAFDATFIMTNDSDLTVNVSEKTHVMRYKARRGYVEIGRGNYETELSAEFGCNIPYNSILLFKTLCGDKSDNVPGIKGFGPKKFDQLIERMRQTYLGDFMGRMFQFSTIRTVIHEFTGEFWTPEGAQQAEESNMLVMPNIVTMMYRPGRSTPKSRKAAYEDTYGFKSLV